MKHLVDIILCDCSNVTGRAEDSLNIHDPALDMKGKNLDFKLFI